MSRLVSTTSPNRIDDIDWCITYNSMYKVKIRCVNGWIKCGFTVHRLCPRLTADLSFPDGLYELSPSEVVEENPTHRSDLLLLWCSRFTCFLHAPRVLWPWNWCLLLVSWQGPAARSHPLLHERLPQLRVDRTRGAAAGVLPRRGWSCSSCYWRERPGREPEDLLKDGDQPLKTDVAVVMLIYLPR